MIDGERVAERMRAAGLSQAELARRVGVSQPTIFKLIHENKTGSTRIHQIARELRTTPAYLMGETDDPESDAPIDTLSSEEREWIDLLRSLEPADRKTILQLARSLAQNAASSATLHSPKHEYRADPSAGSGRSG